MLSLAGESGSAVAHKFPFTLGRSSSAGMRLDASGVWDIHASIQIREGRFYIQPEGAALLLINNERSAGAFLRIGDQLSLGGARLTVALAPAVQHRLAGREVLNWLVVAIVAFSQVLLLLALR